MRSPQPLIFRAEPSTRLPRRVRQDQAGRRERRHDLEGVAAEERDAVVAIVGSRRRRRHAARPELASPIITGRDQPEEEVRTCSRRALPVDKTRHVGEAVAVAVARSRYIAEDACDLIEIEWETASGHR